MLVYGGTVTAFLVHGMISMIKRFEVLLMKIPTIIKVLITIIIVLIILFFLTYYVIRSIRTIESSGIVFKIHRVQALFLLF